MHQSDDTASVDYPHGRGYGHDYMRGGEVLGGYGYADREEYAKRRGEGQRVGSRHSSAGSGERAETKPAYGAT